MKSPDSSAAQLRLPLVAFAAASLLHVDVMPAWCSAAALGTSLWRLWPVRGGVRRLPPTAVRVAITLLLVGLVAVSARALSGLTFGTAMLLCMGAAKLTETRGRRDAYTVVAVALFLLLAAILDRQALARLPLYAIVTWLACAALAALAGRREAAQPRVALATAGRALLWAVPLALAAFLFFPRVQGGLWGLPGSDRAQTGLGEEMSPGSISELSVSDAVAFRVQFTGAPPPPEERYWRGPVLHEFDGYTWRRARTPTIPQPREPLGPAYTYRLTLEPHGRTWWYSLDTVDESPSRRVRLSSDDELLSPVPVTKAMSYDASSHTRTRALTPLSTGARRLGLRLPAGRNPRSVALAGELRARHPATPALVEAVLQRFRSEGFRYTLTPPLLDLDSVDDFLFRTRQGFCGHFASAFVTLMRAAGVPARVVTGYQGGEWNALGGYLVVRQSDAHAWAEVWLEGSGWVRVDPTAAAAPERLRRGFRELQPGSGDFAARLLRGNRWLARVAATWDAANTWWQTRVLDFDRSSQLALLARLGLPDADYPLLAGLLLGAGLLWSALFAWRERRAARGPAGDRVARAWRRLRRALQRAGLPDQPHLPAAALAAAAGERFPELGRGLGDVAGTYQRLRYGPPPGEPAREIAALESGVRRLERRLRRRARDTRLPGLDAAEAAAVTELLPLWNVMPPQLRAHVGRLARRFLDTVPLVGCGGLVVDARMRAVIAFQACLLVCTRDLSLFRPLRSVLVYPDEFVVEERDEDEAGVVTEGTRALSGQSEDDSRILLSWRDVQEGLERGDGYNVVLHEFAHYLDHLSGGALSAPGEDGPRGELTRAYEALCAAVDAGEETLIDPYGAEDPAEFFAVCTEVFFELSLDLRAAHPAVYEALARFYGLDPAAWDEASPAS